MFFCYSPNQCSRLNKLTLFMLFLTTDMGSCCFLPQTWVRVVSFHRHGFLLFPSTDMSSFCFLSKTRVLAVCYARVCMHVCMHALTHFLSTHTHTHTTWLGASDPISSHSVAELGIFRVMSTFCLHHDDVSALTALFKSYSVVSQDDWVPSYQEFC